MDVTLNFLQWKQSWATVYRYAMQLLAAGTGLNSASVGKKITSFSLVPLKIFWGISWDEAFYYRNLSLFPFLSPPQMNLSQCLSLPGKFTDAKHPCKGRVTTGRVNSRAWPNGGSFRGRPGTGTLLLDMQLSMLHLINRRLEGRLSIYRFMNVCVSGFLFSQTTWQELHRTNWYYLG